MQNLFVSLQLLLNRVTAVKHLPVHHYSADYILWSFGIIELIAHLIAGHEQTQ